MALTKHNASRTKLRLVAAAGRAGLESIDSTSLNYFYICSTSVIMLVYEFTSNRHNEFLTQLPFELKLTMPKPDRGGRGYSDGYVANTQKELSR